MNWSTSECKNLQPPRLTIWWLFIRCDNPGQTELLETEELSWGHRRGKWTPRKFCCQEEFGLRTQEDIDWAPMSKD